MNLPRVCRGLFCSMRAVRWLLIGLAFTPAIRAQSGRPAPSRLVTQTIDDTKRVTLHGTVHPLAQARFDQGAVADSFTAGRLLLMLNRPPERETALRQFLLGAHTKGTVSYHNWVTPEEFGERFGPADADIQAATAWLTSHGFSVARVTKSKQFMEFSGSAANVREAFHTEIHKYKVDNETYFANATEPEVPEALAALVRGISPMNNFPPQTASKILGAATYSRGTGKAVPLYTNPNGATSLYVIAPEDFATQYDLSPLYSAGVNGNGQTIGIIGVSNIDISLVNAYRQLFNLSANPVQVVVDGAVVGMIPLPDSGLEAYLDTELSGAVAPQATVNLYISSGSQLQDPLTLATLRAIEDNQAAVLSLSVEECEQNLTDSGDAIWSAFWEQAAAQGQTVMVATGDSGSAGCDFVILPASHGLAVNGFASTSWNVAVGGTDFYYSNYAAGTSAAAPYWKQTNDTSNGSLIAPLPEQPWDEEYGFNILTGFTNGFAGGGGASSCVQTVDSTCTAGYPKPIWQNASGVPSDGVRDVPDVSLFASEGANLSTYAICANEGDCAAPVGGVAQVTLVGGTSASAPAMAGIMALVNQKYGRQGQADFTLYALARQQPSVFHDVTVGTNNVQCEQGTQNCSLDTNGDGFYSLQEYPAGAGYDLASGLGSVDGNALVTNWNTASSQSSATTLSISPTSFAHGTSVTLTANVAGTSGSGTPTGAVAIGTTSSLPLQASEAVPLMNGTAEESLTFLPGGSYQVTAEYMGDGVFGPSTSAPVNITVTPEQSSILFEAYGQNQPLINTGGNSNYGQPWVFTAEPYGTKENGPYGLATGTVTFSVDGNSQQEPVNAQGLAEYNPGGLSVGTHSVSLSYPGDPSFEPSTAGPFMFTVSKGTPNMTIPFVQSTVPVGGSLLVTLVTTAFVGSAPTGNIVFTLGTNSITAPLVATPGGGLPEAIAATTFANLTTTGPLALSASYGGDENWSAASLTYAGPVSVVPNTLIPTTTTISITPSSITRSQSATLQATVQESSGTTPGPRGSVTFYYNGQAFRSAIVPALGGLMSGVTGEITLPAILFASGSNQVIGVYSGDSNYSTSTSAPATINVDLSAFLIGLGQPRVAIASGQSGTVPVVLNGIDGFNAAIAVGCTTSSPNFTCSVSPSNPMVLGVTPVTLTINAYTTEQAGATTIPAIDPRSGTTKGLAGLAVLALVIPFLPASGRNSRRTRTAVCCGLLCMLALVVSCGGGSATITPPPPQKVPTPAGTYGVVVSATANGTIQNTKLIVVVQ